jgi:hypothetical protein
MGVSRPLQNTLTLSFQFILHHLHLPLVYKDSQMTMEQRINEFLDLLFYGIVNLSLFMLAAAAVVTLVRSVGSIIR